jgi:hypothetical protein
MTFSGRCRRMAARAALGMLVTGGGVASAGAGATTTAATTPDSTDGSIQLTVTAPGGDLVDGYCLIAGGTAGQFTTAASGSDGNAGEIVQANVAPGPYTGTIYDCGGGGGDTSNGNLKFSVTSNTQSALGQLALVAGGSIVGQLLDQATGAGAPDVSVSVYDAGRELALGSGCTDPNGNYAMGGLPVSGVRVLFGGANCSNDAAFVAQWYGGTGYYSATTVAPDASCCGTQLNPTTMADDHSSKNGKVTITGMTFSGTTAAPTFTLSGTGFGTRIGAKGTKPPCKETKGAGKNYGSQIYFNDNKSAQWQAGTGGDCIGIVLGTISPTAVSFTLGSWYAWVKGGAGQGTALSNGDPYTMTFKGAHFTGLVSGLAGDGD